MDSSCALLFSALCEMETCLGVRLAMHSTSQRTAGSEPFYDNLDEEPFVDPVIDAAPASDHIAVTGLTFATPACVVRN
jgi:hypothetical protein